MAKKNTRLLLWLGALLVFIIASVSIAGFLLLREGTPSFSGDPQWLHVRLTGGLSDAPATGGLLDDPADLPPMSSELSLALRDAASDPDIKGLYIDLQAVSMGRAQMQEVRDAIQVFRDADKPCVVWSEQLTNSEYYIASACGDIRLMPTGITLVNGLSMTQTYYAETLSRLGIEPNFEHVGDFKSAVEPYERSGPSEAAAEATAYMLDSMYSQLRDAVQSSRGLTTEEADALINNPPMTPADALARNLVDQLQYRDEVLDEIGSERRGFMGYLRDRRQAWAKGTDTVAVIYASGSIVSGESGDQLLGGSIIGDQTVIRQLQDVREDPSVKAVVLRVNSPGGSGSASDRIWRAVQQTKEEKPVVVSMGDYAASGGYYIAMGSDRIFAEPGTLTGSIGVFGGKMDFSGFYEEWLDMTLHTIERGDNATLLSMNESFDESGRAIFRSFLQGFYTTFVTKAAEGRGMSYDQLHAVAQGRVWTGEQALERGLVDELGGTNAAIAAAAELASIEDYAIQRIPERKTFFEEILEELNSPDDPDSASIAAQALLSELPAPVRDGLMHARRLERVFGPTGLGVAAMLPYDLEIR
jgi:protease-4